jgi:DNA recombination protein RmuC
MSLDRIILQIGSRGFTLFEVLAFAGAVGLLLLVLLTILVMRGQRQRFQENLEQNRRTAELEFRLAELSGTLHGFAAQSQGLQESMHRTLDERLDQVSHRVGYGLSEQSERTTESLAALHERLAVIDIAQANLVRLSTEVVGLKDILNNKQSRGAFGQGRMEAIIQDGLHTRAYQFQATLSNGTRPDCIITLPDSELRLVIDAKFPLESYNALKAATTDQARKQAETQMRNDVLRHVHDISGKYLISGETHETAIMFVPSESIYADLHEHFEDVIQKAHRQRVIIASPNVLMLLVQTMQAIVKDAVMREQAHVIKAEVSKLLEDVTRLKERTGDLKKHFDLASADIEKITISSDRIMKRGMRIESLEVEEPKAALPEAARPKLVKSN